MAILRFLVLPFRAPLLLLLFGVAVIMGNYWSTLQPALMRSRGIDPQLFWTVELLQALAVVVICTMPDLLMRQVSLLMASSRAISLIVTLLLVITGGLYLLRLSLLADVLILATSVLLARLDLTRIRVAPSPLVMTIALSSILLLGIWLGQELPAPLFNGSTELVTIKL